MKEQRKKQEKTKKETRKNNARVKMFLMGGSGLYATREELVKHIATRHWSTIPDTYNEGTICLVNGRVGTGGMVFRAWAHKRMPLSSQWLVLRIGGAHFLHCWFANSIWLERAESLITKR